MAMVSLSKYNEMLSKAQRANARVKNIKAQAEEQVLQVVQTAEIGGSAFTHAMLEGYWNGVEFLGIPLPLLTGTGFHLLGFFGIAPEHMHNFGDGAYAQYAVTLGLGIGEEMRAKSGGAASGALGRPLSDAALEQLAAA
jgi:hypothetical protein